MWVHYRRIFILAFFFIMLVLILLLRLVYLQIIEADSLAKRAVKQRIQEIVLDDGRGDIFDRHGNSLTKTEEEKVLVVFPSLIDN